MSVCAKKECLMVKCECGCETGLVFEGPRRDTVYVTMQDLNGEMEGCSMRLDASGVAELMGELRGVLKKMGEGSGG